MSETPSELRYAESHEWARLEEDGQITVGITDFAQEELGDIVFVELPQLDQQIDVASEAGIVESVKAASDIYAPVSGTVISINEKLEDEPETVNEDPYGEGWFFRIKPDDLAQLENLLDSETYLDLTSET